MNQPLPWQPVVFGHGLCKDGQGCQHGLQSNRVTCLHALPRVILSSSIIDHSSRVLQCVMSFTDNIHLSVSTRLLWVLLHRLHRLAQQGMLGFKCNIFANRLGMRLWRLMESQHVVFPTHGPLNWSRLEEAKWYFCLDQGRAWLKMAVSAGHSDKPVQVSLKSFDIDCPCDYRVLQENLKWSLSLQSKNLFLLILCMNLIWKRHF